MKLQWHERKIVEAAKLHVAQNHTRLAKEHKNEICHDVADFKEEDWMMFRLIGKKRAIRIVAYFNQHRDFVKEEIKRLVNTAFLTGQRAQQEPLESFSHLIEQRDWLVDRIQKGVR
jgi:hypothetical protein